VSIFFRSIPMEGYKYFVGGIPPTTTEEQLANDLSPYGEIMEAMCCRRHNVGRGFGFVTFANQPDPMIMEGGVTVNGNVVNVKPAIAEEEIPIEEGEKFKFFIGGIPREASTADLHGVFGAFGSIKDATVLTNPNGSSRGFAFVTFHDAPDPAILSGAVEVFGTVVTIKESVPLRAMQHRKLFVGGLPKDFTEEHLNNIFSPYGPIAEAQVIRDATTGESRGFGFIVFQSDTGCLAAKHQYPGHFQGIPISIRKVEPKTAREDRLARGYTEGRPPPPPLHEQHNEYFLRQQLAAEQQQRLILEARLARIELGLGVGLGKGFGGYPGMRGGRAPRYRPY